MGILHLGLLRDAKSSACVLRAKPAAPAAVDLGD
jgi:hypothetical protein